MLKILIPFSLFTLCVGFLGGWLFGTAQPAYQPISPIIQPSPQITSCSSKPQDLQLGMRKLWEDHVMWTRLYMISYLNGIGDTNKVLDRLMKNQEHIGEAMKSYYGEDAGNQLTTLLTTHIALAGDVVKAAKAKDTKALAEADIKWYDNGNEIADFLHDKNPNWPQDMMRTMMRDHLDLTRQEAVDLLVKRYDAAIADYDKVHNQILQMADMLTDGIISQYPDKF